MTAALLALALLGDGWTAAGWVANPAPPVPAPVIPPAPDPNPLGSAPPPVAPPIVQTPSAPVAPPARYRLADATGQVWEHADRAGLEAYVAARNAQLAAPAPPQVRYFSAPSSCSTGRCPR